MISRGYTTLGFKVQCIISWWQLECNDVWTLLIITKRGWSVKIKLIQEELFLWVCIGSIIIWWKPFNVLSQKSFVSFAESMSLNQQQVDLGSKLPNVTEIDDLRTLMSDKRCPKFAEELSNYLLLWMGKW